MSQGLCCRCLLNKAKHIARCEFLTAILSPSEAPEDLTSRSWFSFFFEGKKPDGNSGKTALELQQFTPLKTESHDTSMELVYMFTYMKAMKINDSCRYTILWIVWDCLPPPKKKKSNWKVQPAQTRKNDLCWPFPKLPFGISTAFILTKDLGPRRGVIFWKPRANSLYWR